MMSDAQAPAAASIGTLKQRIASLGAANAFDYVMQFLLPVILTRFLAPEAFGEYRLLWLVIMTVMLIAPANMHEVLYYFLPRSDAASKRLHVHQTLLYLVGAGVIGGLVVSHLNPWLPTGLQPLSQYGVLLPALVALYSATLLLDILPTIEERIGWQAAVTVSLSLLRTLVLAGAAYLTGDLRVVLWMLLALMILKLLLLMTYIGRTHGFSGAWFEPGRFRAQFSHAAPLGAADALYGLRGQSDQWVAASLLTLSNFAAFSIAAVLGPMVNLFRRSVNHVFLPNMSRLHANDDLRGMLALNSRANVMVATLVLPMLGLAFLFAEELVTLVYTGAYVAAAPAIRIYVIGLVIFTIELSSMMLLLRQGTFVLRLNLALLCGSIALSWLGALSFGLAGAAIGSTAALFTDRVITLRRIAAGTGIRVRNLQDWGALIRLCLCTSLAVGCAWVIVSAHMTTSGPLPRLLIGGGTLAVIYAALLALSVMASRRRQAAVCRT